MSVGGSIAGQAAAFGASQPNPNAPASTTSNTGPTSVAQTASVPTLSLPKFKTTQGWYIAGGITVSVLLANTKAGPFLLGILGIALIYQVDQLLQHK